jgi:hypothetical protein
VLVVDVDQLLGLGVGERLEQDAVDDAEDGRVRPDAERERRNCGHRDDRLADEGAEGVADVVG